MNTKAPFYCGLMLLLSAQTAVAETCSEAQRSEGERYYQLAMKAGAGQDFPKAIEWLQRSVNACDSYQSRHLMGVAYQRQRALPSALDAFSKAADLAPDSDSLAISVARYGQVLALNGQRYEALTMLERAMELHSEPPAWIREQAKEIDLNIVDQPIERESIKRSLSNQQFGLLSSARLTQLRGEDLPPLEARLRLPINFEFDSVELDELTRANLTQLGAVLSEEEYGDRSFLLIGHTDVRGERGYNDELSKARAKAIREALEREYPQLQGRLTIRGAGERDPKYPGSALSEEEHRLNRRLEVFVN